MQLQHVEYAKFESTISLATLEEEDDEEDNTDDEEDDTDDEEDDTDYEEDDTDGEEDNTDDEEGDTRKPSDTAAAAHKPPGNVVKFAPGDGEQPPPVQRRRLLINKRASSQRVRDEGGVCEVDACLLAVLGSFLLICAAMSFFVITYFRFCRLEGKNLNCTGQHTPDSATTTLLESSEHHSGLSSVMSDAFSITQS